MTRSGWQKRIPSLSTILILIGVALMVVGTYTTFQYRPRPLTAAEQSALQAGEATYAEAAASIAPALLPAPGAADLSEKGDITSLDADVPASVAAPGDADPLAPPALPGPEDDSGIARRPAATATPTASPTPRPVSTSIPALKVPDRIAAPTIGLDSKVVEVGWKTIKQGNQWFSEWETADYAVGFHKLSALPGKVGNTVFSGHNNIKGEVFRNLVDLNVGDPISVWADGREYKYLITDKFIVREVGASLDQRIANARWIAATEDERITLVSCWPYWTNTHRVVVVARPVAIAETHLSEPRAAPDIPTGGADCTARPAPGALAEVWQNSDEMRKRLGCPVNNAQPVQTTQQFFKGGRMVWRPDTASIAVLYDDGRWQNVTSFNGLQPTSDTTLTCAIEPKLGFGKVWGGVPGAKTRLGCPAGGEQGVTASAQMFEGGTALIFGTSATPILLFRDGTWAAAKPERQ